MKIYVLTSLSKSLQLSLDVAHVLEADVLIVEKAGGITTAYPISDVGKADLETLGLRSHRQPELNTSFYPIPMILENAKAHLEKKFKVEYLLD